MKKEILNIETVHQCNCCMGCKTLHPLVSVVDLSEANLEQRTIRCDFYTIILIEGEAGKLMYGRKYYDYSNATLIFRMPGESIKLGIDNMLAPKGRMLAFHPDLMAHTALGNHIGDYSFFFYKPNESLHLSSREKMKITECRVPCRARGVRTPGRMHRRRLHHAPAPSFPRAFIECAARAVRRILLLRKAPVPANACGAWAGCFRRQRPAPDAPGNAGSEQHPVRACVKLFYCPVHFLSISKKHPAQALCRSAGRSSPQVSYDLTFL